MKGHCAGEYRRTYRLMYYKRRWQAPYLGCVEVRVEAVHHSKEVEDPLHEAAAGQGGGKCGQISGRA